MDTSYISLLLFTLLSGASAGLVITGLVARLAEGSSKDEQDVVDQKTTLILFVLALVLLVIGLVATLTHLGQPMRFLNGLSNPTSMIAQESYWGIALLLGLAICTVLAFLKRPIPVVLYGITAIVACGLMCVSALAYMTAKGMPGWSDGSILPLFVMSSLLVGAVLMLLLSKNDATKRLMLGLVIVFAFVALLAGVAFAVQLSMNAIAISSALLYAGLAVGALIPLLLAIYSLLAKDRQALNYLIIVLVIVGAIMLRISFFSAGIHL